MPILSLSYRSFFSYRAWQKKRSLRPLARSSQVNCHCKMSRERRQSWRTWPEFRECSVPLCEWIGRTVKRSFLHIPRKKPSSSFLVCITFEQQSKQAYVTCIDQIWNMLKEITIYKCFTLSRAMAREFAWDERSRRTVQRSEAELNSTSRSFIECELTVIARLRSETFVLYNTSDVYESEFEWIIAKERQKQSSCISFLRCLLWRHYRAMVRVDVARAERATSIFLNAAPCALNQSD